MESKEYYFDENDNTVSKEEAKKVIIRETDENGHIYETYGFFEPKKEKPKNNNPVISDEELMKKYNELFNKK